MRTFTRLFAGVAVLGCILLAVALWPAGPGYAQSPRAAAPVVVTNTPLPVTGTVGVSGSVTVANTAAIPVRLAESQPTPLTLEYDYTMRDGESQGDCSYVIYTVPAGQRLVVEYVNIEALAHTATQSPRFGMYGRRPDGTVGLGVHFWPQRVSVNPSSLPPYTYSTHSMARLYYEAGGQLRGCASRDYLFSEGDTAVRAVISALLVPAQ